MEVLFENKLIRNRDVFKSFCGYNCFQRPISIIMFCICGVCVILNILQYLLWWDVDFGLAMVYAIAYVVVLLAMYSRGVNNCIKRDKEQFGTDSLLVTTSLANNSLQCTYGELQAAPVALDQIKKVVITKKLILMFSKAKLCYILDKNNFTVGTYDDFIAFLRSKGLKVKGA